MNANQRTDFPLHIIQSESSVNYLDAFRINHELGPSFLRVRLEEVKGHNAAVHNLFRLGHVRDTVRQKQLKKVAKPDRVPAHNHVVFLDRTRKDKIAKFLHANQAIGVDGFVARVQTHVGLAVENVLKVAEGRGLFDPRRLDNGVRRGYGKRIGVAADYVHCTHTHKRAEAKKKKVWERQTTGCRKTRRGILLTKCEITFLQCRYDQNLVHGTTRKAVFESSGDRTDRPPQTGAQYFGSGRPGIGAQDGNVLRFGQCQSLLLLVGGGTRLLFQKHGQLVDLGQAQVGERCVVEPADKKVWW